jgi:hypothetical protein
MDNVSSELQFVNKKIRKLDAILPRERTIKVFGLPENNIAQNETAETDEELEEKFRNFTSSLFNVQLGMRDVETAHRVGAWQKTVPRSVVVYLANNDVKNKLIHVSNSTVSG